MVNPNSNEQAEDDQQGLTREVATSDRDTESPIGSSRRSASSAGRSRSRRGFVQQEDPSWRRGQRMQSRLSLYTFRSSRRPCAGKMRQVSQSPFHSVLSHAASCQSIPRLEVTVLEALEAASEMTSGGLR